VLMISFKSNSVVKLICLQQLENDIKGSVKHFCQETQVIINVNYVTVNNCLRFFETTYTRFSGSKLSLDNHSLSVETRKGDLNLILYIQKVHRLNCINFLRCYYIII